MVKINLEVIEKTIQVTIVLRTSRGRSRLSFIIDTGSPETIIPDSVARELQLNYRNQEKEDIGLIGIKQKLYGSPEDINFKFLSGDGQVISEKVIVKIVVPYSDKPKEVLAEGLLGMDFLQRNNFILHYDPVEGEAYLEKV